MIEILKASKRIVGPCAVGIALIGFAGCGGSQPEPAATTTEDAATAPASASEACGLLTAEEIGGVMGASPGAPQPGPSGTESCNWPSAAGSGPIVEVWLSPSGYSNFEAFVASYQSEFGGEEPSRDQYRPIDGLGDWAMYVVDDGELQIHRAGRMLQVTTSPPSEERAVALGQKAVARLQ
jgi:hypothetical protein